MKALVNNISTSFSETGQQLITLALTSKRDISDLKEIVSSGKLLEVEISKQRKKRSLDSNSYLWTLCQKIAEAINSTKELVYQKFIRDVGQFEIASCRDIKR